MKKNNTPQEHEEQTALFTWQRWAQGKYPGLELMHAIPNGGKRDLITAARLKAEGVKAGVPDIFLPVARGGKHGMYIELKRRKGGRPTPDQLYWLDALSHQQYHCALCFGWEHARDEILKYLNEEEESTP